MRAAGLALVLPTAGWAEVCDKVRPNWDGQPTSLIAEAAIRFTDPLIIGLLMATIIVVWAQSRIGSGVIILLWGYTALSALATSTLDDDLWEAMSEEGCRAHVDLFIGLCAAICITTLISVLRPRKTPTSGD